MGRRVTARLRRRVAADQQWGVQWAAVEVPACGPRWQRPNLPRGVLKTGERQAAGVQTRGRTFFYVPDWDARTCPAVDPRGRSRPNRYLRWSLETVAGPR